MRNYQTAINAIGLNFIPVYDVLTVLEGLMSRTPNFKNLHPTKHVTPEL
jgi:hypothetical protein